MRYRSWGLRNRLLRRRRRVLHGCMARDGGHILRYVGLRSDDHGRSGLVGCLLRRRRRRHVLVLVGTRLPSRRIVMRLWSRMGIVLLRVAIRVVHRRLRRRVVERVCMVFLLPPGLGIHGRALVHVRLALPGRHVMVHHACRRGGAQTAAVTKTRSAVCERRGGEGRVVCRPFAHID